VRKRFPRLRRDGEPKAELVQPHTPRLRRLGCGVSLSPAVQVPGAGSNALEGQLQAVARLDRALFHADVARTCLTAALRSLGGARLWNVFDLLAQVPFLPYAFKFRNAADVASHLDGARRSLLELEREYPGARRLASSQISPHGSFSAGDEFVFGRTARKSKQRIDGILEELRTLTLAIEGERSALTTSRVK